ncbi:MAG: DUF998 domain-containing protein [Myxococcales bacterium]|nr:DUF998 domain-containing protein [Myxococcales bacterium]
MQTMALGGVAGPLVFAVVIAVCGWIRPDYSHLHQFISELGASGTGFAPLMNYGGFVVAGVLLTAFGVSLLRIMPDQRLPVIGSVLTIVFGLGVASSGLISCDPGCPQVGGSTENFIHDKIAPIAFISLIVATWILGVVFRRLPEWRSLSLYSLVTGFVALGFLVALVGTLESRVLTGLWQRLLLVALFLWTGIVGTRTSSLARGA